MREAMYAPTNYRGSHRHVDVERTWSQSGTSFAMHPPNNTSKDPSLQVFAHDSHRYRERLAT